MILQAMLMTLDLSDEEEIIMEELVHDAQEKNPNIGVSFYAGRSIALTTTNYVEFFNFVSFCKNRLTIPKEAENLMASLSLFKDDLSAFLSRHNIR